MYVKLGKSCREVDGIAREEVSMDAVQRTINLRASQYVGCAKCRNQRTRNVTFPSLKKYVSCRTKESSGDPCSPLGVFPFSDNPGKLVCLTPDSALGSLGASEAVGDTDICQ